MSEPKPPNPPNPPNPPEPPPLQYEKTAGSTSSSSKRSRWLAALGGLLLGTGLSAAVWIPFWARGAGSPLPLILVVGGKIVAGILCIVQPNWRAFGVGLLCSIATGFLIFFGACAMNFKVD